MEFKVKKKSKEVYVTGDGREWATKELANKHEFARALSSQEHKYNPFTYAMGQYVFDHYQEIINIYAGTCI